MKRQILEVSATKNNKKSVSINVSKNLSELSIIAIKEISLNPWV